MSNSTGFIAAVPSQPSTPSIRHLILEEEYYSSDGQDTLD